MRRLRRLVTETAEVDELAEARSLSLRRHGLGRKAVSLLEVAAGQRVNEVIGEIDVFEVHVAEPLRRLRRRQPTGRRCFGS